jgi:hypothetical protein
MHKDARILGAMLRLARKREAARIDALVDRVGGTRAEMRAALRGLEGQGLVERVEEETARLTFVGFAIAVASRSAARSLTAASSPSASATIAAPTRRRAVPVRAA